MVDLALEVLHAGPVREVTLCGEAKREKHVLCLRSTAILGLDDPLAGRLIKLGAYNSCIESAVLLDIQFLLDVCKVCAKLVGTGVSTIPVPVFPDLWHRVFVDGDL